MFVNYCRIPCSRLFFPRGKGSARVGPGTTGSTAKSDNEVKFNDLVMSSKGHPIRDANAEELKASQLASEEIVSA
jgi:hypothetical protein